MDTFSWILYELMLLPANSKIIWFTFFTVKLTFNKNDETLTPLPGQSFNLQTHKADSLHVWGLVPCVCAYACVCAHVFS